MILVGGTARSLRNGLPYVGVGVAAIVLQPLDLDRFAADRWWSGLAVATIGATLIPAASIRARHRLIETIGGLFVVIGIALLRDGAGGSTSGMSVLYLLPVMWFASHATRPQLAVVLAVVGVALVGPLLLIGDPSYPSSSWRGAVVLVSVAVMFGLTTKALRDELAHRGVEAARSAAQMRGVLQSMSDPIARYQLESSESGTSNDLRCVLVNEAAQQMIGRNCEGERLSASLTGGTEDALLRRWIQVVSSERTQVVEYRSTTWRPGADIALTLTPVHDGLVAHWRDVTEIRRSEAALHQSRTELASVADAAGDAVLVVGPDLVVLDASATLNGLLGIDAATALGGSVLDAVHRDDAESARAAFNAARDSGRHTIVEFRARHFGRSGEWRWLEARVTRAGTDGRLHVLLRDVSELRAERDLLNHRATHDELTGLLNRDGLARRVTPVIAVASTVVYIDLDAFKPINDTYGHAEGDAVLVEVARRIESAVRDGDLVARVGGDEFVIMLIGETTETDDVVDRIRFVVNRPVRLAVGSSVALRASLGTSVARVGERFVDSIARADESMYRDKVSQGLNCPHWGG